MRSLEQSSMILSEGERTFLVDKKSIFAYHNNSNG